MKCLAAVWHSLPNVHCKLPGDRLRKKFELFQNGVIPKDLSLIKRQKWFHSPCSWFSMLSSFCSLSCSTRFAAFVAFQRPTFTFFSVSFFDYTLLCFFFFSSPCLASAGSSLQWGLTKCTSLHPPAQYGEGGKGEGRRGDESMQRRSKGEKPQNTIQTGVLRGQLAFQKFWNGHRLLIIPDTASHT